MTAREARVIVVGAGPAGLAAARAMAEHGVRGIVVIDRDDAPGGLPRFCHHPGFGWEYSHRLESGPRFAARLINALDASAARVVARTTALAVHPGPVVEVVGAECGHARWRADAVVLATGIRERPRSARLVPGRRPERGVLTTGQLQQLVARGVPVGGARAVVVGTEHVAFSVLLTARRAELRVVAMVEPEDRVMSFAAAGWIARLTGVPLHLGCALEDIEGDARVEAVVLRGRQGARRIACDTVVFAGDFAPDAPLALASGIELDHGTRGPVVDQFGRTRSPGVFAAGNVLRAVESSGRAAIEGSCVGRAVAAHLAGALPWRDDATEIVAGDGLLHAMPQRWARDAAPGLVPLAACLAASRDAPRARLRLEVEGTARWTGDASTVLRKRRLVLPAAAFASLGDAARAVVHVARP